MSDVAKHNLSSESRSKSSCLCLKTVKMSSYMGIQIDGHVTDTNSVQKLLLKVYNNNARLTYMEVGCCSDFIVLVSIDIEKVFDSQSSKCVL